MRRTDDESDFLRNTSSAYQRTEHLDGSLPGWGPRGKSIDHAVRSLCRTRSRGARQQGRDRFGCFQSYDRAAYLKVRKVYGETHPVVGS